MLTPSSLFLVPSYLDSNIIEMSSLKNYKELRIWKESRELNKTLWTIQSSSSLRDDLELRNQINKSSGSIMDNIAEGFERDGNKEFRQFLSISKASSAELESQLYRALDRHHIDQSTFNKLSQKLISIQSGIGSLLGYLKNSDLKGQKKK